MCSVKSPLFKHFIHLAKKSDLASIFQGNSRTKELLPSQVKQPHRTVRQKFHLR
jgi:hypothetical protein